MQIRNDDYIQYLQASPEKWNEMECVRPLKMSLACSMKSKQFSKFEMSYMIWHLR